VHRSTLRHAASRSLFDWCACVRAGAESARAWPLEQPARLALAAHLRDQDDLHYGSLTHPGGVVWSAVATCALEREVTVGDAIAAAAFGYELTVRVAEAAGPEHRQRWHVTTTAGTVGAAGAAARLLGADDASTSDAVAHAASVAGGAAHAMVERTTTRFLHRAHAVESALTCARAACAGKRGGRRIFVDGRGTFVLPDAERLTATRPSAALEETGFRLHPATGFAHSALDAALTLRPIHDVEHVRVGVSPIAAALASNPQPNGDDERWWSIEHAVASALGVEIDRVEAEATAEGWAATVDVRLRDCTVRSASATEPLGHPARPASDDDLRAKWTRLNATDGAEPFERIASAGDSDSCGAILLELVASVAA
jgi:2-methylcitrate dehydratase PrpD